MRIRKVFRVSSMFAAGSRDLLGTLVIYGCACVLLAGSCLAPWLHPVPSPWDTGVNVFAVSPAFFQREDLPDMKCDDALRKYEEAMTALGGCGNHDCLITGHFRSPGSLGTNANCKCHESRLTAARALGYAATLYRQVREAQPVWTDYDYNDEVLSGRYFVELGTGEVRIAEYIWVGNRFESGWDVGDNRVLRYTQLPELPRKGR